MIKIAVFTSAKHIGDKSIAVVRIKHEERDIINTIVADGKKTVAAMELLGVNAALSAISGSVGTLEIHSPSKKVKPNKNALIGYDFKSRKLHTQEAKYMKRIADEKFQEVNESNA